MPKAKRFDELEVLRKAERVFNEKGYNGTSMDDLVQATGLSRSSIYDTFGDKHGLFLKALGNYQDAQNNAMEELLSKTNSYKKKIRTVFDYMINDIVTDKARKGCMMVNANMELNSVDKEVAQMALTTMEDMEQQFYMWIKEGQATGEISKKFPAKALARNLYNNIMGLRVTGRNRPDYDALREMIKITLSLLDQ
ncbi:TetR/AcrR family transcriptional regulator [Chitinophaga filiformis]|uniref:TetR/AcrR family transcriptional regulator n=1 Tax=Chitinophaga filiformis TaxID=104663 RepID=A0ABY4I358_CHIFI|nr:TetR/AcrR family transcriptional regulator [Chitinophaga filiformis]UPK70257.1 TetR/AcrR family transcriptional regulator [Chitinophaga filiformis]